MANALENVEVFHVPVLPRVDEAKAKALKLIDREKLETALGDPWIDRYLQDCIRVYGNTIQGGKNAALKLVLRSHWIIPQLYEP